MSNTDSFIDEVNEEVRRDRLYQLLRRYGWIIVVAVLLVVGGAAWNEYRKAQARAEAEALGDAMLAAIAQGDESATALGALDAENPAAQAVLTLLTAAQQVESGQMAEAVESLDSVAVLADIPEVYRQIARFKSLTLHANTTSEAERRQAFEAMAQPGQPFRVLAIEQLALIDIQTGDTASAIDRYQAILSDVETTEDLQQRARQVIVALGGDIDLSDDNALVGQ